MSKRKGLSADEKRKVILDIYHCQKEPFNLKEIEKLASKRGVVLQTIKDQNKSLVDDALVQSDKIGSSVFFWSFPSQVVHSKKQKIQSLYESIEAIDATCDKLSHEKEVLSLERTASDRPHKLERLNHIRSQIVMLSSHISSQSANNPEVTRQIVRDAAKNKAAADRWTDNVWSVKKYCTRTRGMAGSDVDKLLGIDGDFDYLCCPLPGGASTKRKNK